MVVSLEKMSMELFMPLMWKLSLLRAPWFYYDINCIICLLRAYYTPDTLFL